MQRRQRGLQALPTRSLVLTGMLLIGCSGSSAPDRARVENTSRDPAPPPSKKSAPVEAGPRFVDPDAASSLVEAITTARAQAVASDRQFLVYVGASWCEPCRYFHDAVVGGELDTAFPRLDLIEFDLDRDKEELFAAGYQSRLIPLFAKARADGHASTERHAGGIKGPKAVGFLTQKLEALLGAPTPPTG